MSVVFLQSKECYCHLRNTVTHSFLHPLYQYSFGQHLDHKLSYYSQIFEKIEFDIGTLDLHFSQVVTNQLVG